MSKHHTKADYHGCYTVGERVHVREGPFAGHHGVIHALRDDGRPVLKLSNGVVIKSELVGYWVRPDIAPPPTMFYDRHLIPLTYGEKIVKVAPR